MPLDERLLLEAREVQDRLLEQDHLAECTRADFNHAVRRLQAAGGSLREIAEGLGLSHQRVHQIVNGSAEIKTSTRGRSLLLRLSRRGETKECKQEAGALDDLPSFFSDAREAMRLAEEEARALGQDYLGTEHILLGLTQAQHGLASHLLSALGVDHERARTAVLQVLGRAVGPRSTSGPLRWMPRVQEVLGLARKEAKALHSVHVRSEHLLLGLTREGRGVGARVLAQVGVDYDLVRGRVARAGTACSFCGLSGLEARQLIAGPGVYICDRCVAGALRLEGSRGDHLRLVDPGDRGPRCSFCGKRAPEVERLVTAGSTPHICDQCLALCQEIEREEQG